MNYRIEKGKRIYYKFECNHCGDCCRFLDILLEKEDILKWIAQDSQDILQYIQIQPESISADFFIKAEMEGKLEERKEEILKNHYQYQSEDLQRDSVIFSYLFLPELGNNCILIPQTFQIALDGMQAGIKYMFLSKNNGDCIFFSGKNCTIYELRPLICTRFPFDDDGTLAINDWTLYVCKGIKRIKKIK